MEHLRYVARAAGVDTEMLVQEAAAGLASLGDDRPGMVTACRRMVQRHPASGPLWWLCSRMLTAADLRAEARAATRELDADPSAAVLASALPEDAVVCVLGWPDVVAEALTVRGDVRALVVDCAGQASALVGRLARLEVDAEDVATEGLGAAAAASDLVLVEASAAGPAAFVATAGSRAAAAVARDAGREVWLAAGTGRWLPTNVFSAVDALLDLEGDPWERDHEVVPLRLVDRVATAAGMLDVAAATRLIDCPIAPELLR